MFNKLKLTPPNGNHYQYFPPGNNTNSFYTNTPKAYSSQLQSSITTNGYQQTAYMQQSDDLMKTSPTLFYAQQNQLQQTPLSNGASIITNGGTNGQFNEINFSNNFQNMTLSQSAQNQAPAQSQMYLSPLNPSIYFNAKSNWSSQELAYDSYTQN